LLVRLLKLIHLQSDVQGGRRLQRWQILIHLTVEQGQLQQVLRKVEYCLGHFSDLLVPFQEAVRGGSGDLELEFANDILFHREDLLR
jgi:hypothetical protein